ATTSFLIDKDILIDAGTGVSGLTLDEMRNIRHIFITHSHLDHIASIPLLADTLFDSLAGNPIIVHAQKKTLEVLQNHIFNWDVWPDFTTLPGKTNAVLKLNMMKAGTSTVIDGRKLEMIPVNHVIPGVGYRVESAGKSFVFSGDTTNNESLWAALNKHDGLDLLFIEVAFANKDIELARQAFHYCPEVGRGVGQALIAQVQAVVGHSCKQRQVSAVRTQVDLMRSCLASGTPAQYDTNAVRGGPVSGLGFSGKGGDKEEAYFTDTGIRHHTAPGGIHCDLDVLGHDTSEVDRGVGCIVRCAGGLVKLCCTLYNDPLGTVQRGL
ncbi:MAG: 3',5'-cyclic-nucleotide phosphodiesterase, partial [Planctomycetes bacterium]|nr:3',5'-cyclic-nucleotide phosphodiesterase [Planctomycetota bacterium]